MTPEQERLYLLASAKANLVAAAVLVREAGVDLSCAGELANEGTDALIAVVALRDRVFAMIEREGKEGHCHFETLEGFPCRICGERR